MTYYVVKVYGLVCDLCEHSEEFIPTSGDPQPLAATRRYFRKRGWRHAAGRDICPKTERHTPPNATEP